MDLTRFSVIREPDDPLADVRISLGSIESGAYLVFRGDPAAAILLLKRALIVAEAALPTGGYEDRR